MASAEAGGAFLGVERSIAGRRWWRRLADERAALAIAQALGLPEVLGRVLAGRGVALEEVEAYLNPTLRALMPDPSALRDMDKAVDRLAGALARGELVAIIGDYDVDGATASALLRRYFEAVGGRVRVYIPDRLSEGYGPNGQALRRLAGEGAAVVITVDCGTTAFEALGEAKRLGLDAIVVDHHQAGPRLPEAVAVVNPNRLDDESGQGALAAVGVAFLLAVGVNRRLRQQGRFARLPEPDLRRLLDLVALGTVCDLVPLARLNRALVAQGLKVMAQRGNAGLAALADVAGLDQPPGTYHLGFVLGPRINAGGRVGRADLGHRLLVATDPAEALALARELDRHNAERRAIESVVLEAALRAAGTGRAEAAPLAVAAGSGWHPGVIGLVASRLVERLERPTLVLALDGERAKGSARSVPGVDIGAVVTAARQAGLLVDGGGHPMAAGLTVERRRLADLVAFMTERVAAQRAMSGAPSLAVDGALALAAARRDLLAALAGAGPYGSGNPEPRFAFPEVTIVRAQAVGDGHLRCILAGRDGGRLKAIGHRLAGAPLGQALLAIGGRRLHVAGRLRADDWRGREGVELALDDAAYTA